MAEAEAQSPGERAEGETDEDAPTPLPRWLCNAPRRLERPEALQSGASALPHAVELRAGSNGRAGDPVSQSRLIATDGCADRARPNEMEFSGERSESAATTG